MPVHVASRASSSSPGPALVDPNFRRTVVLVGEHSEDGALGRRPQPPLRGHRRRGGPGARRRSSRRLRRCTSAAPCSPRRSSCSPTSPSPSGRASLVLELGRIPSRRGRPGRAGRAAPSPGLRRATRAGGRASSTTSSRRDRGSSSPRCPRTSSPTIRTSSGADVLRRKGGPFGVLALMPPDPSLNSERLAQPVSALPRPRSCARPTARWLRKVVDRYGMRLGAARFVAGETLDECVPVLRRLNGAGLHANTTLLGEAIPTRGGAARTSSREYERILERLAAEGLRANVALKLTHLGLAFDEETAYANLERVVAHAGAARDRSCGSTWSSRRSSSATLRIYERLRDGGHENVGVVLQSYLYRTPGDLERLLPLEPNLRIVKGAYLEPAGDRAIPEKRDVDIARTSGSSSAALRGGAYVAVATHDERDHPARAGLRRARGDRPRPLRVPDALRRAARAPAMRSRRRATRCSSRRRSAPTGTRTSCAGSPSARRTSSSSSATSCALMSAASRERAEVVVVGGGAIGTSIAFHLAEAGVERLPARARRALVRLDEPGGGRHPRAVLGSAEHRDRAPKRRGVHALRRAAGRRDRLPPGRVPVPARPRRGRRACSSRASPCRTSSASRVASSTPAEAAELSPLAGLEGVLAATFCPLDGHASPEAVAQGYAAGARAHGATVVTGCGATGIEVGRRRGSWRRSPMPGRSRRAPSSCAAGVWSPALARDAGVELPVEPIFREVVTTAPGRRAPRAHPAHGRLHDRLLLPPRGPGPPHRDGGPRPAARVRRPDRPGLARARHRGRGAACARVPRDGHRARLEGLLRGHAGPQRARRRGRRASSASSTRPASPGTASCRHPRSARSSATSISASEPFVDVAPLSVERFAHEAPRPEHNVI